MRHLGRVMAGILAVLVVLVIWYATAGDAVVVQHLYTNSTGIASKVTWVRSDGGLYGGPVTAIGSLQQKNTPIYAGTDEDDIFASATDGRTWVPLQNISSGHYVVGIELEKEEGEIVVGKAVYGAGFFLSRDGGRTWKGASRGLDSRLLSCLAAPVGASGTLFAGTGDTGLFVSRDGGLSWRRIGGDVLGSRVMAVSAAADGRTVYAGTQETGLSVSLDGGGTWKMVPLSVGPEPLVTAIDIDPANELRLAVTVTGVGVGLSMDGGLTWTTSRSGSLPSDCTSIHFLADGASGLVVGTQSGALYFSEDGLHWQSVFQVQGDGHVYGLACSGTGMLAATSDGVVASPDGLVWNPSSSGITNLTLEGLAVSPVDASVLVAATDQGVFRSQDAGISWERCSVAGKVLSVLMLEDGHTVLAGRADGSILRSVDGGDHWASVSRGIPGVKVSTLALGAAGSDVVYAGTDNGCAVGLNAGLTWQPRNEGLVATMPAGSLAPRIEVAAILPDPGVPGRAVLSLLGQGLYVTNDEGNHWQPLSGSVGMQWTSSLAVDPKMGRLYAGTSAKGILVSKDSSGAWSPSGTGLSSLLSVPGAINTITVARDGTVYAGTQERGIALSRDGGVNWQRVNAGLPALDVHGIALAGNSVLAITSHHFVRLQTQ